jgi:hypothetical protein
MNKDYKKASKGKLPTGLIVAIISAFITFPVLVPFVVIIAIIYIAASARNKNESTAHSKINDRKIDNKVNNYKVHDNKISDIKKKIPDKKKVMNIDSSEYDKYVNMTVSEKRLDTLRSLYENGIIDKNEYDNYRKGITI